MPPKGLLGPEFIQPGFLKIEPSLSDQRATKVYAPNLWGFATLLNPNSRQHCGTVLGEDIGAYVEIDQDRVVRRAGWGDPFRPGQRITLTLLNIKLANCLNYNLFSELSGDV